jgi:hypothetical protein
MTKNGTSFHFIAECKQVVAEDIKRAQTPAGKVGDMIREHNQNKEKYSAFEELAYKGMK